MLKYLVVPDRSFTLSYPNRNPIILSALQASAIDLQVAILRGRRTLDLHSQKKDLNFDMRLKQSYFLLVNLWTTGKAVLAFQNTAENSRKPSMEKKIKIWGKIFEYDRFCAPSGDGSYYD